MPALPNVPNVLRIDHVFKLYEDLNAKCRTFWKYLSGPPTNAELAAMAVGLKAAFATDLSSLMSAGYDLTNIIITDLTSPTAAQGDDPGTVAGTRSGDVIGAEAAVLQSRQIARRYRGGHPRIYWPFGVANDLADAQTWTLALTTACVTGLSNYENAIAAGIGVWGTSDGPVNVSYYEGFHVFTGPTGRARNISNVRTTPVVDPVIGLQVPQGIAVQRNRNLHLA